MERKSKDTLLEDIDKELRAIDARLKKVISKTDGLLKESSDAAGEAESNGNAEITADAADGSSDHQD